MIFHNPSKSLFYENSKTMNTRIISGMLMCYKEKAKNQISMHR